jgi:hypothetical protein
MEKKGPNSPDFKEKKSKSPDLDDKFQWVTNNIEIIFLFLFSYLVCNQTWLNYFLTNLILSVVLSLKRKLKKKALREPHPYGVQHIHQVQKLVLSFAAMIVHSHLKLSRC